MTAVHHFDPSVEMSQRRHTSTQSTVQLVVKVTATWWHEERTIIEVHIGDRLGHAPSGPPSKDHLGLRGELIER